MDDGVARKQRDDLVGARHAEMRAAPARRLGDVLPEQMDRAAGLLAIFTHLTVFHRIYYTWREIQKLPKEELRP